MIKASISGYRFWRICVYNWIASHLRKPNLRNVGWKLTQPRTCDRSLTDETRASTFYIEIGKNQFPKRNSAASGLRVDSSILNSWSVGTQAAQPQSNDGTVAVKSNPIINKLFIILKTRKIYLYHTPNNDMAPNSANRTLNSGWSAIHDIFIWLQFFPAPPL